MSRLLLYAVLSLPLIGAYALLGLGITVIYQASRVLNLAHGAFAMMGAYATLELSRSHVPVVFAVAGGVAIGAVLGLVVERVLVRRLRSAGPTTQTVGTVAALTLGITIVARVFGSRPVEATRVLPSGALHFAGGYVSYDRVGVFPVAIAGAAALVALFRFTDIGLAMRGAAQNRRGAALRGVDPDRTAALAWALGGALAALAGILLAGATVLDPYGIALGVLPAFVAALIGGLESMPGVCIGAALIGAIVGIVPALSSLPAVGGVLGSQGAPELVLGVVALVVMATRGSRLVGSDVRGETL
jgi:branched-subunit amino acid ABC-type transport system permease component